MTNTVKQIGYQFAQSRENGYKAAKQLLALYPDVVDNMDEDVKNELNASFDLKYAENNPDMQKTYILKDGQYQVMPESYKAKNTDIKFNLSVSAVMAETAQKFGSLRNGSDSEKALHALLLPWRSKIQKYRHQTMVALIGQCKAILNEGVERQRSATKSIDDVVKTWFLDMGKKLKAAQARGDDTANIQKFNAGKDAFLAVWNKS